MFVTRFGVSVEKVVATIEIPTSHQGAARPEVKNSAVLEPARFAKKIAGRNEITIDAAITVQSIGARCIPAGPSGATARHSTRSPPSVRRLSRCGRP